MTIFDVYFNDKKICRSGVGRDGVLSAIVSWAKLAGPALATARRLGQDTQTARLHVGGLRKDTHLVWAEQALRLGDRVTIALGSAARADRPVRSSRRDRKQDEQQERRYYEGLKKKYERDKAPRRSVTDDTTKFLNVDLDIYSHTPLDSLTAALGRRVVVLYLGREKRQYSAHLELAASQDDADRAIRRFVALIERLPPAARRLWDRATTRELNIGIQSADKPHSFALHLAPGTVRAAANVNARIGLTVYGAQSCQGSP